MQVNVYLLQAENDSLPALLVLPDREPPIAIPSHLRAGDWHYSITTISDDRLIGGPAWLVDALIQRDGYLLLVAQLPVPS